VLLDEQVGLVAEARDTVGHRATVPDPSGGFFDAAGDFDRLVPADSPALPMLSRVDPYADWAVPLDRLPDLAAEVSIIRGDARPGPEERGLDRLAALIEACLATPGLTLVFVGD
jgi:hypothetical protein